MDLTFLNPALLAGLSASLVPLIIHLLHRRRAQTIPFSTIMLLKESKLRVSTRIRLKELLLLLLRMLVVALVALALSKPLAKFSSWHWAEARRNVALIIDNSYSMNYGEFPPLQKAKQAAFILLDSLKKGDRALLLTSSQAGGTILSVDFKGLKEEIENIEIYHRKTSLPRLLKQAQESLAAFPPATREIYILSDMQKLNWQGWEQDPGDSPLATSLSLSPDYPLILGDMGQENCWNISIKDVRIKSMGREAEFSVGMENFSDREISARILLREEERQLLEQRVLLSAYSQERITLKQIYEPGIHKGTIMLESDPLKEDNVWHYCIDTLPAVSVLIVNGAHSPLSYIDETFYLRSALNPHGDNNFYLQIDEIRSWPPKRVTLSQYKELKSYLVIIWANVDFKGVRQSDLTPLKDFLTSGGNLVIFAGDNADVATYNRLLYDEDKILPGELLFFWGSEENKERTFHLTRIDYRKALFEIFRNPEYGNLSQVQFYKCVAVREDPQAQVLASFSGGYPALLEKEYQKGKVFLFTSTCDTDWSDFPLHTTYLPFLHRLIETMRESEEKEKSYFVGDTVKIALKEKVTSPPNYRILNPRGEGEEVSFAENNLVYTNPRYPGVYTLLKNERELSHFAVNSVREESNLQRIRREELEKKLGTVDLPLFSSPEEILSVYQRVRGGLPLRRPLLLLALLILITEAVLNNRFVPGPKEKKKIFLRMRKKKQ